MPPKNYIFTTDAERHKSKYHSTAPIGSIFRYISYRLNHRGRLLQDTYHSCGYDCLGGGRYDGLIEELGGNPLPACGFGLGLERLVLTMESAEIPFPEAPKYNLSIVTAGENAVLKSLEIASDLRSEGYSVSVDTVGRSIKAQMKYSNKTIKQGDIYYVNLGKEKNLEIHVMHEDIFNLMHKTICMSFD